MLTCHENGDANAAVSTQAPITGTVCSTLKQQQKCTASSPESPPKPISYFRPHPLAKPIASITKTWTFTEKLPSDPFFPTPASSHRTPRGDIVPRTVKGALYTFVRPVGGQDPQLLAVSPAALQDLGISDPESPDFLNTVAGNKLHGWQDGNKNGTSVATTTAPEDEQLKRSNSPEAAKTGYPWAQCYGGYQFGSWAGQLGDGRAISLFETTPPVENAENELRRKERALDYNRRGVPLRYEIQLKGAGLTPYSRFADGKAVLRSSIREFVVSEYLHALGVPTTRALSLVLLPHEKVQRERGFEPGAIVCRFAQSWVRLGTFDLIKARGDRALLRKLADYVAVEVFGGYDKLPCDTDNSDAGKSKEVDEGKKRMYSNRYVRLYREIVQRNARTVAKWQAYGFMNGVLNTDNTSVYGLSMDYGPFGFMDAFDPSYTPNHDDWQGRYSYKMQPTIIWWNLVRLGEALGELMGAGPDGGPEGVDSESFIKDGIRNEAHGEEVAQQATYFIEQAGDEYKAVFLEEYRKVFSRRLGLKSVKEGDFERLYSELLDILEAGELDYWFFFRRLAETRVQEIDTENKEKRECMVDRFFYDEGIRDKTVEREVRRRMGEWLLRWKKRVLDDWGSQAERERQRLGDETDQERIRAMKQANPKFVPRGWVLDEVIRRVEKEGERDVLRRLITMALHPFEDAWNEKELDGVIYRGKRSEEERWTGDFQPTKRGLQCSCSS